MNSGDKILNRIKLDCDARISEINAETDKKCAQTAAQAKLDSDKISAEIVSLQKGGVPAAPSGTATLSLKYAMPF